MTDSMGIIPMNSTTFNITVNYANPKKKEINLEITRLLTSYVDKKSFVAYETNITDIPKITTDYFNMTTIHNNILKCLFKKNSNKKKEKLILLCFVEGINNGDTLSKINGMVLNNINIIYNFRITSNNVDKFLVTENYGPILYSVYPEEIDFNKRNTFIIRYEANSPNIFSGIKLNYNSTSDLDCYTRNNTKECIVTESHFSKSGDYYTYHEDYRGQYGLKSISYEIPTIKVILKNKSDSETDLESDSELSPESEPKSNSSSIPKSALIGIIIGSVSGVLIIIGLIIFFVYIHKKKSVKIDDIDGQVGLLKREIELNEKFNK